MATGFGLIPMKKVGGGQFLMESYSIPASDGTAVFPGDLVKLSNGWDDTNQLPTVIRAGTGDKLLGVVIGFLPDPTNPYKGFYRLASTARVAIVCSDPDVIYQIQEDAVGGSATSSDIGDWKNYNVIVAAGSAVTGQSGVMLDSSTATQSTADLKVLGVVRNGINPAAKAGGAILAVKILAPAINLTSSGV